MNEARLDAGPTPPTLSMVSRSIVSYEVKHTLGPMFDLADLHLAELAEQRPVLIVIDAALKLAYGAKIEAYARLRLDCREIIFVPGDESTKTLEFVTTLCTKAIAARIPRDGAFIAIGGGCVMDMVGFAASIYRRGVGYIRVPTTLIGMIDVSVGIKQGVNVDHLKNIIGSFYAPLGIVNDTTFLATLPRKHLACGVAEAIKIALVCSKRLFTLIEEYAPILIDAGFQQPVHAARQILHLSESAMIDQLSSNLYERDRRRLADFGHTFSPAIESASRFEVPHGEAVAMDMLLSAIIGVRAGVVPAWLPIRLARLYHSTGLPIIHSTMTPALMSRALEEIRLQRDGRLNLVVPAAIGTGAFLQDVAPHEVEHALSTLNKLQDLVFA